MEQRGFVFHAENLLSPGDAVATFLARVSLPPARTELVDMDDAHGRILASDIRADRDYPQAPRSAMDGFALRAADVPGTLRVAGEIAMGAVWNGEIEPGTALRIPTGGVVPPGADAVVPIEDAVLAGSQLSVGEPTVAGAHVNERGCDITAGATVLTAGTRIAATHTGVLATLGITRVPVVVRPRIAVLSSGDELVPADRDPAPGQIRDSNRYAIAATLRAMGAQPVHVPTVNDAPGALEAALRDALETADAVIVTGGSSVGERDRTPAAIEALQDAVVLVHGLRVKPGKPTVLAAVGEKPVIGLPGNPTSAVVILQAVAAPVIAALSRGTWVPSTVPASLEDEVRSRAGWRWFVPVALRHEAGGWLAHPLPLRSSTVSIIAQADGYVVVPEDVEAYPAGTAVTVTRFI